MIDNIKVRKRINESEKLAILNMADPGKINLSGDGVHKSAMIKNISINWRQDYMHLAVSLPTFKYGHNLYPLKYASINDVISEIESTLGLHLKDAHLGRIDVSQNFIVKDPCAFYFDSLLYKDKFYTHEYKHGKSFLNSENSATLAFYDKIEQFKKDRTKLNDIKLIPEFENKNILRYEYRMTQRLGRVLGRNEVLVKDLYDKNLYNSLIGIWLSQYLSIIKRKEEIVNRGFKLPSELKDYLAFTGATKLGGESTIKKKIILLRKQKKFRNEAQPNRMIKMVGDLFKTGYLCRENEHVKELNSKVTGAALMNYA
ncbi:MAG: phage/plasmid replication protein [Ferruginibacter sp.]